MLFRTIGHVPTRYSPVRHSTEVAFDLHVLGLPPAFVLSQDQTLKLILVHPLNCSAGRPFKDLAFTSLKQNSKHELLSWIRNCEVTT